jgi:hypothetical protein
LNQALRQAAMAGSVSQVERWVRRGADVNGQAPYGETALEYAVRAGRLGAARKLVQLGADPNLEDDTGLTPFQRAASECTASRVLEDMLKAGADVNHRDQYGRTALMSAAHADCVRNTAILLLRAKDKIEIDAKDDALETAADLSRDGLVPLMIDIARKYQKDGKEPLTIVRKQTLN